MTRVLLSQSQGAFATALTERLIAAGHDVVLASEGAMVLVVTDLVDDLKVRAQIDPDAGSSITAEDLARLSDMIRSAASANIPRIVLISAAEAPPGGAVGLPALVPAAAMKTAQQLETVLAEVAADRAVVLRTAEVIDPAQWFSQCGSSPCRRRDAGDLALWSGCAGDCPDRSSGCHRGGGAGQRHHRQLV